MAIAVATPVKTNWVDIFNKAHNAGIEAANACTPVPMHVIERSNPLDDNSPIIRRYAPINDGVCGFAWVTIYPGNCAAANFAKKHWGARKPYDGGMQIWVHQFGQSMQKKQAYADAFTKVLRDAGVTAYSGSRMD